MSEQLPVSMPAGTSEAEEDRPHPCGAFAESGTCYDCGGYGEVFSEAIGRTVQCPVCDGTGSWVVCEYCLASYPSPQWMGGPPWWLVE